MRTIVSKLSIVLGVAALMGAGMGASDPETGQGRAGDRPRNACPRQVDDLPLDECGAWDIPCRVSVEARRAVEAAASGAYLEARRALFSRATGLAASGPYGR